MSRGGGERAAARRNVYSIFGDVRMLDDVLASLTRGLAKAAA